MVSFQTPFFQLNQRKTILESDSNSKKRKWDDHDHHDRAGAEEILPYRHWMNPKAAAATTASKYFSDVELHLETPLPSEWQRCLDIQSGEIHFYNTRTQKRTVRDPRESPEPEPSSPPRDSHHMSLDLELNLPCGSLNNNSSSSSKSSAEEHITSPLMMKKSSSSPPPPSADSTNLFTNLRSTLEMKSSSDDAAAIGDQAAEMVATACMRCHMLVMLQKSSPTCPNCKFVHPPYHSPPDLFKPRLSLSC